MKLLDIAIKYIGTQEDAGHTNHGAQVTKWQLEAGLPSGGYAWCASFIYGCGIEAYGTKNPVPRTAGALKMYQMAVESKTLDTISREEATPENILPGYVCILDLGEGHGHAFIVRSVDGAGLMRTVEGNSNTDGSRDGYEVADLHKRHITDTRIKGFICFKDTN